ncbi:hypothetical protein SYNTR_1145 [Candidatus Syntrophocurvum alkaliphilum]|uniref:YcfA family protein n=1 Tax=Candidatus Syntrophocurvum alkaliphilum TaxID=2293317 RepID=A0A6I6DA81_9FIRM|nr:type II toxin-antitoxin system HicA family toxin [Candidatus Syntrophocurvum alkaliphilum]QGT99738.1 hypothetical protein SYNTR_1145 [Candidatus Syntrophocurvum alkaliphilum]
MKSFSSREILAILQANDWYIDSQKGSHIHLKHKDKKEKVTVPHPKKDLPHRTIKSIFKQAGINLSE